MNDVVVRFGRMRMLIGYERRLMFRYQKKLADATKTSVQLTGMPRGSGGHNQVESGAIELAEVEEAYREVLAELKAMRAELEQMLPRLDDPDDIGIMRLRYIDGRDLRFIPESVGLSERAMFYHLAGAERKLIAMFPDKVTR
jgi:hypothetical protein